MDLAISIGNLETIPAKINIEIPFPIPCSVICSPIQTKIAVPATIEIITVIYSIVVVALMAVLKNPKVYPIACTRAIAIDKYLVYFAIAFLPVSPSLAKDSRDGIAIVKSWRIIDAVT